MPAVWDCATNDTRGGTPDTLFLGRHGKVSWLCPHGSFEAEIRVRVRGHGDMRGADDVSGAAGTRGRQSECEGTQGCGEAESGRGARGACN